MVNLSSKEFAILKAIGKYKFLTLDQLIKLGIGKDKGNLSRYLKKLRERRKPLIRKISGGFGCSVKHYLTEIGKNSIKEEVESIDPIHFVNKIITADTQDQKHRMAIIDIEIAFDLHCIDREIATEVSHRYFDTVGENRISKSLKSETAFLYNESSSVKADIITIRSISEVQKEMFVIELENGKDTKKAIEKIQNHRSAILQKSANQKYNFDKGYRTLWIFEHEGTMKATLNRLQENPEFFKLEEFFLFKPLNQALEGIYSGWFNLAKKERKLYYRYS